MKKIFERIERGTERLKRGFAKMQKGGVIMDVVNAEQAKIAENSGAVAVMALERVPADIRKAGGVARMADPRKIKEIMNAVTIPVMAKCRIGHFAEAQVLQELGVDMIDESEVLTPADEENHIEKTKFTIPFVCGARNLGEALRRINEGAAMIRTKGEPGTGNVVEAVRHMNLMNTQIAEISNAYRKKNRRFLIKKAKEYKVPLQLVEETAKLGRLPVVNFAAGGIATPSDASLMMQLGADGIFVGSGIFKSSNPERMAKAIVEATMHYDKPRVVLRVSKGLGEAMRGVEIPSLTKEQRMQERGTD
jgi:pyridoxal 5'-phosphate synthase pdxS subunit